MRRLCLHGKGQRRTPGWRAGHRFCPAGYEQCWGKLGDVEQGKEKIGADASAAAGPKGRDTSAETDAVMKAQILSYSRAKGVFVGVSLEGSTMRSDGSANQAVCQAGVSAKQIVREGNVQPTPEGKKLIAVLEQASPKRKTS